MINLLLVIVALLASLTLNVLQKESVKLASQHAACNNETSFFHHYNTKENYLQNIKYRMRTHGSSLGLIGYC